MADTVIIIVTDQSPVTEIIITDAGDSVATVVVQDVAIEAQLLNLARSIEPGAQRNRDRVRMFGMATSWNAGAPSAGWLVEGVAVTLLQERLPPRTFNAGEVMSIYVAGKYTWHASGTHRLLLSVLKERDDGVGGEDLWLTQRTNGMGGLGVGNADNPAFPSVTQTELDFIFDIKVFSSGPNTAFVHGTVTIIDSLASPATPWQWTRNVFTIDGTPAGANALDTSRGARLRLTLDAGDATFDSAVVHTANISILGYGRY